MLRIALCDDEYGSREELLDILKSGMPEHKYTVREYPDGEKLLFEYNESLQPFDLIILDLEMPVLDGFETAEQVRKIDRDVPIVIVTRHGKYVAWGYDVHAWHYLIKPVSAEKLFAVLRDIAEARELRSEKRFALHSGNVNIQIPFDRILYFESRRNCVYIHTVHLPEAIRVYKPLCEIELLCGKSFVKSHHSFLVNIYHIESVSRKDGEAVLYGGKKVRVSKSKIRAVLEKIESRIYNDINNY